MSALMLHALCIILLNQEAVTATNLLLSLVFEGLQG
jgi:hypothetical protein